MKKKKIVVVMAVILMLSCLFTVPALAGDEMAETMGGPGLEIPKIEISGYSGVYDGNWHGVQISGDMPGDTILYLTDGILGPAPQFKDVCLHGVYVQVWRWGRLVADRLVKIAITPAKIMVTADDKSATYGDDAPALTYSLSGFVAPDDESILVGTPKLSCAYKKGDDPGSYAIEIDKCSVFSKCLNYVVCVKDGTLSVGKKALTVAADDKSVVFGDAAPTYTVKYSGFIEGEAEDCLGGSLAIDCAYAAMSAVGTYPITPSGLTSDKYDIAFSPGTLTVAEKIVNVMFVSNGGSDVAPQTVSYAGKVVKPADPGKTGYGFKGWYLDNETFLKSWNFDNDVVGLTDVTLYAKWAINTYAVKFVDFDGKVLSTQTVNYGSAATAPANPARDGYTFTVWDKDYSKITSDLTVTALYKINTYTVKFVDFDGKVLSTQTVNYGSAATAPANPVRSGYTFASWDKDYSKVISDLTVTAQYKQNVSSNDEDIPGTFDSGAQPFPWLWVAVAAVLVGAIVAILVTQAKRHKKTGDAV